MIMKKIIILLIITISLISVSFNVSAYDNTLTITDRANDVLKIDENDTMTENVSQDDVDIKELKCIQNNQKVEISLQLNEDGKFGDDPLIFFIIYIVTTSPDLYYQILYSKALLEEGYGDNPIFIVYGYDELINATSFSGEGTDTITIEFNLETSSEKVISLSAFSTKETTAYGYIDKVPEYDGIDMYDVPTPDLNINAGGFYEAKTNQKVELLGTVISGEITQEYEWFWTVDESSITLNGQNPSYTFKIQDTYTGTLYVYDGKGSWGFDTFQVNVTTTSTNDGNNNNNEPGFELILVVAAIAIALILFRKKKK